MRKYLNNYSEGAHASVRSRQTLFDTPRGRDASDAGRTTVASASSASSCLSIYDRSGGVGWRGPDGVADCVLAEALGRVHEFVGGAKHLVNGVGRRVPRDDADAEGDAQAAAADDREKLTAHAADDDARRRLAGLRHEDCELVAAESGHEVNRAHVLPYGVGDGLQQSVARAMALSVVDELEVVNVNVGDGERVRVAARALDLGPGHLAERPAVESARQIVCARKLALVFEGELEGGDEACEYEQRAEAHGHVPVGDERVREVAGRGVRAGEPGEAARRAHKIARAASSVACGDEDRHDVED